MSLAVLLTHLHSRVNVVVTVHAFLGLRNQVAAGSAAQQAIQESFSALVQGVGIDVCWKWIDWQTKNPDGSAKPGTLHFKLSIWFDAALMFMSVGTNFSLGIGVDAVWVLSALKSAARVAQPRRPQLSFFQSHVLSLARECDKVAATSKRDSVFHRSRVLDLWALLPAFCNHPCDISMALPTLATTLSRAIVDKRYPQLVVRLVRLE
jgi:ribosomal RNA-processing protein 12